MKWRNWRGKQAIAGFNSEAEKALNDAMEAVGEVADSKVPLDEGTLRRSRTIKTETQGFKVISAIGYGGGGVSGFPVIPYAVKHHEVPANFQHGREHNYLRGPFNQMDLGAGVSKNFGIFK